MNLCADTLTSNKNTCLRFSKHRLRVMHGIRTQLFPSDVTTACSYVRLRFTRDNAISKRISMDCESKWVKMSFYRLIPTLILHPSIL